MAAMVVAVALALALGSASRRTIDARYHHGRRPVVAAVTYRGAGPSCVNVWMGGNPRDPNACRPAPGG